MFTRREILHQAGKTAAIATGYGLEDGANVRLVMPGDAEGFKAALADVLGDDGRATALGARARATVTSGLTWDRFVGRIEELLDAAAAPPDAHSRRE